MAFRTVKSSGKAPPLSSSVTSLRGLERLNCDFCYALLGSKLFGFVLHSKAIAWSPYVNDLASGDWTLIDAYAIFNPKVKFLFFLTYGCSHNQIIYWIYLTISKIATLTCHAYRVMYVAVSPDGKTIVTRARDETLRFWNVFPSMKTQNGDNWCVCRGQKHYKLEIAYLNKVRCLSLESGTEGDFNALGFLQVPGFDDIFNGDDDTYRIRKLGLMWISLSSPTARTF
ncbi:hypothetical protein Bca4012_071374 [Brassica carinata]|uniref:(rape) hypothetical protein n=1 Tax=Brassica napus TaxID=3708 RepID=A0A816KWW3_BRANA|nr:unnamed protein product [Brassica napus]